MALVAHKRKIKRKVKATRTKTLSLALIATASVLILYGQLVEANPLLLAGLRLYRSSKEELRTLETPYSFRDIYPGFRRCGLDTFIEDEYHDTFRFDKALCRSLVNYLVRFKNIPEIVRVPYMANNKFQYHTYHLDEIMLMTLMYSARPIRLLDVAIKFGRTPPEVSIGVKFFHEILYPIAKDFLQNEHQAWFNQETVEACAEAIAEKGCPLDSCLGYVDGNLLKISDPGPGWLQNTLYNGHKKAAGYTFIGVVVPNGMCLLCLGPSPGRRHDAAVAAIHHLYEKLNVMGTFPTIDGCFSGDKAFPSFWPLIPMHSAALTPAQAEWNTSMSRTRITVEWMFGETVEQFSSLKCKRRLKILSSPVHKWYINCTFLNNLLNTSYPNAISQFFNLKPPCLETYLGVPLGSLQ